MAQLTGKIGHIIWYCMHRYPPTRNGVHSLLFLCSIQNFVTRCPSKIPSPKSKIQDPQNPKSPKSPNSKIQTLHIKICYIMFQKSKIQNPENPKSPKSKIQNPQNPKSQNPHNPKSKLPKIQNPKSPKSKIIRRNPKFGALGAHVKNCFLMMQNPKSKIPKIRPKKLGFWILGILDFGDFGF